MSYDICHMTVFVCVYLFIILYLIYGILKFLRLCVDIHYCNIVE